MIENVVVAIHNVIHPIYSSRINAWRKWRLTYESGDDFIDAYLKKFSKSEEDLDFTNRRSMSYCPAFSKVALIEVRNTIYQRMPDITRVGGSYSYQRAISGRDGGVDLLGSSMNTFIGTEILEELLVMGKVGVYIDMPELRGITVADNQGVRPYLYTYKTEDIRSWIDDEGPTPNQYKAVLLRDTIVTGENALGMPSGLTNRYRHYYRDDNGDIYVQFYNGVSEPITPDGLPNGEPIRLKINKIPFVCRELNNSLMADICNYQIALLNLASTDMAYACGANFPFYVEQFDPRADPTHLRSAVDVNEVEGGVIPDEGVYAQVNTGAQSVHVGPASGRKYPKGLNPPDFIHPSPEPMRASMDKQEQLKMEIRLLINLTISNIQPKMASAESKGMDVRSLESGLSYIGLILEDMEREIAEIWHKYENEDDDYAINYPEKYTLRNEKDVWTEVEQLKKNMGSVPSLTYKRTIAKRIAELLIGHRVTADQLEAIHREIDTAKTVDILVDLIEKDVKAGILAKADAAEIRGYPKGTVDKATEEQAERIRLIQLSQTKGAGTGAAASDSNNSSGLKNPAARGVSDLSVDPNSEIESEIADRPTRGKSQVGNEEDD